MTRNIEEQASYTVNIDFMADPATIPVACDGCDWTGMANQLNEIGGCSLTPGHPSPAGRCPECDTLAYVQGDAGDRLREIEAVLRDHPDVDVGNSKVHFAYMKAKDAQ